MPYNSNWYMPQYSGFSSPLTTPAVNINPAGTFQQTPINGLVPVTGIDGAKAYQLPPNSSMPLFDKDSDIFYLKTTDGAGFPTIKQFKFEEINTDGTKSPEYVPRSEFDILSDRVNKLILQLTGKDVLDD